MRVVLIALGLVVAATSTCDEIAHCGKCASTKGNILGNCRWCPLDSQCHAPGAVAFNPCSTSQNIVIADQCPPIPTPQTTFSKDEAVEMTQYSRAAYAETAEVDGCAAIQKTFLPSSFTCMKSAVYQINYANRNFTVLSYYGYDTAANRIVLSFRGSVNSQALWEALVTLTEKPLPFPAAPTAMINPFFSYRGRGPYKSDGGRLRVAQGATSTAPVCAAVCYGPLLGRSDGLSCRDRASSEKDRHCSVVHLRSAAHWKWRLRNPRYKVTPSSLSRCEF
jgi:hypothetical protein